MGGIKYTDEEIWYLKNNWNDKSIKEMASFLNRGCRAVERKLSYLGFTNKCAENIYTIYDDYAELKVIAMDNTILSKVDMKHINKLKEYTWNISNTGYLCARINGKIVILHRYILNEFDSNIHFDHINQDKMDNREINLRKCTKAENNQNKFDANKSSTGCRGVSLSKNGTMEAKVKINKIQIFLKSGRDLEELDMIAKYARAYIHPFSEEHMYIKQEDIPQWIKDKIDKRLNSARK